MENIAPSLKNFPSLPLLKAAVTARGFRKESHWEEMSNGTENFPKSSNLPKKGTHREVN